ncbi:hypothetical protein FB639_004981, partial [Coemansia asiatica]
TKQFISYDDPQSLKIKVDYAASKGLAGTMVWSMNMDYNEELMNVLLSWQTGGPSTTTTLPTPSSSTTTQTIASSSTTQGGYSTKIPSTTTTSTTATSVTSSTSSVPQHSSTSTGGPVAGGACSSIGLYQCADNSGKNSAYFLCLYGKWVAQSCGSGTACFQS